MHFCHSVISKVITYGIFQRIIHQIHTRLPYGQKYKLEFDAAKLYQLEKLEKDCYTFKCLYTVKQKPKTFWFSLHIQYQRDNLLLVIQELYTKIYVTNYALE